MDATSDIRYEQLVSGEPEAFSSFFPEVSSAQYESLIELSQRVLAWNKNINLISRKDTEHLWLHHILHSMSIYHLVDFAPGTRVLDLGTGGGFPGLVLAILYPDCEFLLIDARAKKIKAVQDMISGLALDHARAAHIRAEDLKGETFQFIVSRAVSSMEQLRSWSLPLIDLEEHSCPLPNGLLVLKGGNLGAELRALPRKDYYEQWSLREQYIDHSYYDEKYLIYWQR